LSKVKRVNSSESLSSRLAYEPRELHFGTSGRRGEVKHLSQLEVYLNVLAELKYLQTLAPERGGVRPGDEFYFAYDLRPSSTAFVPQQEGRGQLAQTIERAIRDAGMTPVNLGCLPTPALTYYALRKGKGSIMVTGSHIPFDRNGYKLNTSAGELLKEHEGPVVASGARERERLYAQPFESSVFDERGFFKSKQELSPVVPDAGQIYLSRYTDFFAGSTLSGMRLLVYEHSAVGRDLLVDLLRSFGAEVIPVGRSKDFVPIDTENIDAPQLQAIQKLVDEYGPADAVVSTDGDSDRPLLLGIENGRVKFFGGDLIGMIVAEYLRADAVVVPISCNDAIDRGPLAPQLHPKTRIGSPFVIAGMEQAQRAGKRAVCGWEANGGFLLGSDIERDGRVLAALPTRDAFLPLLCTLFSARERGVSLSGLFRAVATRFSRAGLLKNFPRPVSVRIVERFSPRPDAPFELPRICQELAKFFRAEQGFGAIVDLNYIDGVRILFDNGEIAHLRPSGNADELRVYAVADSQERAEQMVAFATAEPSGILRQLEKLIG
jgi:phosphomannomutase